MCQEISASGSVNIPKSGYFSVSVKGRMTSVLFIQVKVLVSYVLTGLVNIH